MDFSTFRTFSQRLAEAGIALVTRWEATPYIGSLFYAEHALSIRHGLLSRRALVVGNEAQHLESVRRYVLHHPQFRHRGLAVRSTPTLVKTSQFVLVQRTGYEGGVPDHLREIIIEAGGDEDDVHYALNVKEEQLLGYIPVTDRESAQTIAGIVQVGATSRVSREEVIGAVDNFRDVAIDRLRRGDTDAGAVAATWQKLANFWRGQPPSKDH
jgi:hypothetical protein